jgi:hypothetical protein
MFMSLLFGLSLLVMTAGTTDVIVVSIPTRGDISLTLGPSGKTELKRDGTVTRIRIELDRLAPPSAMGMGFSAYVGWAVSPDGVAENLGEIAMDKDKGRLEATTRFEQVGVLITAEPHYMVDRPSAAVAFRNQNPRGDDIRRVTVPVEVGLYDYSAVNLPASAGVPALVMESRAAIQIAKISEADRWAESEFRRARVAVDTMEEMISRASPFEIVAQTATEAIRRSQYAVAAAREKKAAKALESARSDVTLLKQESAGLNARIQQLSQQQNAANTQIQKLQTDVATANRENQRVRQEMEQVVTREQSLSRELLEFKAKQEELQNRLVLQLRDDFYDLKSSALTPTGRNELARLGGMADTLSGQVRLEGPAADVLFDAAKQYLIQAGVAAERIILKP